MLKAQNLNKNEATSAAGHRKTEKHSKKAQPLDDLLVPNTLGQYTFYFHFFQASFSEKGSSRPHCLPVTTPCRSHVAAVAAVVAAAAAAAYKDLEADLAATLSQ